MISKSCIKLIEIYFRNIQSIEIIKVFLGKVNLNYNEKEISEEQIIEHFNKLGFSVVTDPDIAIVEQTKIAAIELIHYANNANSLIRNSDYISERVQISYDKISKIFSRITNTTLEKYIILLKIEKAKELIVNDEISLSEISYILGYSSVQYLSNQFKKITGLTVSQFKNSDNKVRIPLENLLK